MYKVYEHVDIEGDHLSALITRVREQFLSLSTIGLGREPDPTSLSYVASQVMGGLSDDEELAIVGELLAKNRGLHLGNWGEILKTARTPHDAFFDIVYAIVVKALRFDPSLREEDDRREPEQERAA